MPNNEIAVPEGILFTFAEISYTPETPRMNEPFTVRGKIELFSLPFFGPIWVIATVTYPEKWWEEIIPIWGSPEIRRSATALGGDFEIAFPTGFDREGEFSLAVRAYGGPTTPVNAITLPPFPPVASMETVFTVSGEAPPGGFQGEISKKELEYDETRGAIPVSNVPQGKRGLVHIWGRNDTTEAQRMGISWTVKDPDGLVVEEYSAWEAWPYTGAGSTHEFIGGRFNLDKAGTYTIDVELLMDSDNPIVVGEYSGSLCTVGPEEYKGTISKKELEYDETRGAIPVSNVPQSRGLVHIWGRNDMTEAQRMAISWVVKDPDGLVVEEYSAWEVWPYTGAGDSHEFIGGRFNLDKPGTYTIDVALYMNPDSPVAVDSYQGNLCTVAAAVFKGTISKKELEYDETRGTIPVSNVSQGKRGLVHIWGRNDTTEAQRMGISWVTKDPDGQTVEEYSAWEAVPYTGAGSTHEFIGGRFNLDKAGTYTIDVALYMNPDNPVAVDSYQGNLCTVAAAVFKGTISKKELEYDETRGTVPVSNVPQGKEGLVHVWGRNDMSTTQRMGIYWVAKDPDGVVVEEYTAWEAYPYTGAGDSHEFIGGRFNLNKAGTYTINVGLLMNPDSPVYVDTYYGTLCTVAAAVFKGTISKKELEYNETRGAIPVSNVPQGKRGLVHIWGRNDMSTTQRMGISWIVKNPNGVVVEEYSAWEAYPYTGAGSAHEFIGGRFNLDKAGTYTINVGLFMNPDNPTNVDTYYGTLCTVVAAGGQIALTAGWNEVTYTGVRQTAGVAMQSIASYLEVAYYYDAFQGIWVQIEYSTILEPGMTLNIKVSQDCVWTF